VPYMNTERPLERIYELGFLPAACKVRMFELPRIRDPRSLSVIRRIAHAAIRDDIDVLHILAGPGELWLAALSAFSRKIPVAATMIIPKPNVGDSLPAFISIAIYKLLAKTSDIIIINGTDQIPLIQRLYGIEESRVAYVPLGPRTTAGKWALQSTAEKPGTVLFFGEARRHKGLEYLVKAQPLVTRQVPNALFLIASRGEELERCQRFIRDKDKFEIHKGFIPGDRAADFFQRASVVVLPYLSASTSGILMTAYIFGRPVVATNVGCLPEYVEDGITGVLVPPADIEKLAEALVRLLSDPTKRCRMGEEARRWSDDREKRVAHDTLLAYERAIAIHRKRVIRNPKEDQRDH